MNSLKEAQLLREHGLHFLFEVGKVLTRILHQVRQILSLESFPVKVGGELKKDEVYILKILHRQTPELACKAVVVFLVDCCDKIVVPAHDGQKSSDESTALEDCESGKVNTLRSRLAPLTNNDLGQLFEDGTIANTRGNDLRVDPDGPLNCLQ